MHKEGAFLAIVGYVDLQPSEPIVIPAKAGIHLQFRMDPVLRRDDDEARFSFYCDDEAEAVWLRIQSGGEPRIFYLRLHAAAPPNRATPTDAPPLDAPPRAA